MKFCKCICLIFTLTIILSSCFQKTQDKSDYEKVIDKYSNLKNYNCVVEITVKSNKTINKYTAKQFFEIPEKHIVEYLYPENIKGLSITYNNKELEIYYPDINKKSYVENQQRENISWHFLDSFFKVYFDSEEAIIEEKDNDLIVLSVHIPGENKYRNKMQLEINKCDIMPLNLKTYDCNGNLVVDVKFIEFYTNENQEVRNGKRSSRLGRNKFRQSCL